MAIKISKEFKIGLFGVTAIAILYLGFNYLKGEDFFKNTKKYYAVYENIDGLTVSNSVFIKGLSVGRVSNIAYQQDKGKITVEIDIDGSLILGDSTVAFLINSSFLGGKAIDLRIPEKIGAQVKEGDTLISSLALGMIESLTQKTLPVADDLGALIRRFNTIMESFQKTEIVIRETVIEIKKTVMQTGSAISENRESLKISLSNIEKVSQNLDQATRKLNPILSDASAVMDSIRASNLKQTLDKMEAAVTNLNAVLQQLNEGKGTAGKLMKDDSLYVNLNRSAADLDKLLVDLKENPRRYVHVSVFGKSDKKK
jgi:phospholipid/cholesterol/gamma-HCH transport system substrate-binding protein